MYMKIHLLRKVPVLLLCNVHKLLNEAVMRLIIIWSVLWQMTAIEVFLDLIERRLLQIII